MTGRSRHAGEKAARQTNPFCTTQLLVAEVVAVAPNGGDARLTLAQGRSRTVSRNSWAMPRLPDESARCFGVSISVGRFSDSAQAS
jgi:hypothetical protein